MTSLYLYQYHMTMLAASKNKYCTLSWQFEPATLWLSLNCPLWGRYSTGRTHLVKQLISQICKKNITLCKHQASSIGCFGAGWFLWITELLSTRRLLTTPDYVWPFEQSPKYTKEGKLMWNFAPGKTLHSLWQTMHQRISSIASSTYKQGVGSI